MNARLLFPSCLECRAQVNQNMNMYPRNGVLQSKLFLRQLHMCITISSTCIANFYFQLNFTRVGRCVSKNII